MLRRRLGGAYITSLSRPGPQPLLIVHGDNDTAFPVSEAEAAFAAAGSKDKTLRVFTAGEGGSRHVDADGPDPARQLIVDWFAQHVGTLPAPSAWPDRPPTQGRRRRGRHAYDAIFGWSKDAARSMSS